MVDPKYTKLVLVVGIICIAIAAHNDLRKNSTVYNLFFPPIGISDTIDSVTVHGNQSSYVLNVEHQYPGRYALEMESSISPGIGVSYSMNFIAYVEIQSEGNSIYSSKVEKPVSQFWRSNSGGVVVASYSVPETMKLESKATISVSLEGEFSDFLKRYGQTKLIFRKRVDK